VTQLLPLVDAIPPVGGKAGRPMRRPLRVQGDRAYASRGHRLELSRRGIRLLAARRGDPHGSGLGKTRWPVERTLSWLHQLRRLRIRTDRRDDIHEGFMDFGRALICHQYLKRMRFC
jgi:transposase